METPLIEGRWFCRLKRTLRHPLSTGTTLRGLMALLMIVCSIGGVASPVWAHEPKDIAPVKSIQAVPAKPKPPRIDGLLNDDVWRSAPIATGFTQRDPDEGKPATEETAFQVAYDDEALYIAIMCYDSKPDQIVRRLYRRDQIRYEETDWVGLRLDPHHDHQTGFGFAITPSGSFADSIIVNDSGFDGTWDSVWEAKTAINDLGWSVELKIPYHALRFSPKEEYTWGINLNRRIIRKQEYDMWVLVPKNESGISSRNGHLEGIKEIHPPRHLEFLPYTIARETFEPKGTTNPGGQDFFSGLGMDIRYGIASNVSLNATINPDFGQVEADPAVLNLTVFETYYEERRPFFVEGTQLFQTPLDLFYSRRIGRQPGYFSVPSGGQMIEQPGSSTILGAAKITGKTRGRTSFGIVEAVTGSEYATVRRAVRDSTTGEERVEPQRHLIEPLTNYLVGRVQQDILGNSAVGALLTAVNRKDAESAYTGGVDWNLRWKQNAYGFFGQVAGSYAGRSDDRQSGYAANVSLDRQEGWLRVGGRFLAISPEFNANDLGFIRRSDWLEGGAWISFRRLRPWGPIRQAMVGLNHWATWNYDGVNLEAGGDYGLDIQFKNYWRMGLEAGGNTVLDALNDWKTRGGPLMVEPGSLGYVATAGTDNRKPVSVSISAGWTPTRESPSKHAGVNLNLQPTPTFQLSLGPSYRWAFSMAEWVTNVDSDGDGKNDHFVFGELTTNTLDLTTRANLTFTPRLSLQLYMQSFVAVGKYRNFKELARPASYEFTPYPNLGFNPDFHSRSLRSNLVLRWEYRPGSTLFLVWSQSRSASEPNVDFHPLNDFGHSFTDKGPNLFFLKLNSWLGI